MTSVKTSVTSVRKNIAQKRTWGDHEGAPLLYGYQTILATAINGVKAQ